MIDTTNESGNVMLWSFVWIGFAVITALAASARGRSGIGWFLLGCLFGVFALIAVLVMGHKARPEA